MLVQRCWCNANISIRQNVDIYDKHSRELWVWGCYLVMISSIAVQLPQNNKCLPFIQAVSSSSLWLVFPGWLWQGHKAPGNETQAIRIIEKNNPLHRHKWTTNGRDFLCLSTDRKAYRLLLGCTVLLQILQCCLVVFVLRAISSI